MTCFNSSDPISDVTLTCFRVICMYKCMCALAHACVGGGGAVVRGKCKTPSL